MINITLVQIEVFPGEIQRNLQTILQEIKKSPTTDLFIFPELCLSGYLIGDLWEYPSFLKECELAEKEIKKASKNTAILFGNVKVNWKKKGFDGRPQKYNAAILVQNQKYITHKETGLDFIIKTHAPNYRKFEESRHFTHFKDWILENKSSLSENKIKSLQTPLNLKVNKEKIKLGVTICEDAWDENYFYKPLQNLSQNKSDLLINISSSPFNLRKKIKRNSIFSSYAKKLKTPLIYINHIGCQNNGKNYYSYDGQSKLYNKNGDLIWQSKSYQNDIFHFSYPLPNAVKQTYTTKNTIAEIHQSLHYIGQNFYQTKNIKNVVIGISGGIDSAVTATLYGKIIPPKNLFLVSMPSRYNSKTTKTIAKQIALNLGCYFAEVPIQKSIEHTEKQINSVIFKANNTKEKTISLSSFHLENIQARDRSSRILSAIASAVGGAFTCNSNKSEFMTGYSTLYGDLGGFLSLLGDLWKKQVYDLGIFLNKNIYKKEIIPKKCFEIIPCAELSSKQNINKNQGDPWVYEYHDALFTSWLENWQRFSPEEILIAYQKKTLESKLSLKKGIIKKIFTTPLSFITDLENAWNLYQGFSVVKRIQSPPIASISRRSFGFDHRESLGKPFYSTRYQKEKNKILAYEQ